MKVCNLLADDDGENGENFEPGGVVGSNPHRGEEDVDDFVISESSSRQQLKHLPPQHIHSKQHKSKEVCFHKTTIFLREEKRRN